MKYWLKIVLIDMALSVVLGLAFLMLVSTLMIPQINVFVAGFMFILWVVLLLLETNFSYSIPEIVEIDRYFIKEWHKPVSSLIFALLSILAFCIVLILMVKM